MKRVIGIGNALTDMLVNLKNDAVLGRFNLAKGSMSLVDSLLQTEISKSVAGLPYSLSLGGSAGNTIRAMAKLGCEVGFIGKVGPDTTGDFFIQALENLHIEPMIFRGTERSGKCVSLISPDGERTMITHLGAALELSAEEIKPDIFDGYDCLYVEGYLVQSHELILEAVRRAKECGLEVAIDLASFNIVAENLTFLRDLVREYVDIVFANEDEAKTFTCEAEPLNALQAISEMAGLAVVKIGTKGALIKRGDEVVHVGIMAAARRVDTVRRPDAAPVRHDRRHHGRQGDRSRGNHLRRGCLEGHLPAGQQGQARKIPLLTSASAAPRDRSCGGLIFAKYFPVKNINTENYLYL